MAEDRIPSGEERRPRFRGPFRRLRRRYYALRRRKMRAHYEKFRHMTARNATGRYRFFLWFRKSLHYVHTLGASVFSFLSPVVFPALGVLLLLGCFWFFSNYTVALAVGVGDEVIGYVASSGDYDKISDRVELQVKNESLKQTGEETYLVESFPTLSYAVIPKDQFTSEEELYDSLYTMASEYTKRSYGLFLDGELIATSKDRNELDQVISTVLEAYAMSADDNLEIINYMQIVYGEYDSSYNMGYGRILDLFRTGPELKSYTVKSGDTLESISERSGISVPVLRLMNGLSSSEQLRTGQTILYGKPYQELVVKNTLTVFSAETIPYQTEYIYSSDYYEGTQVVLRGGSEGVYEVQSHNVYVNGQASSTSLVSKTKIKDPVSRQVIKGTKTIAPSGRFIFPLKSYQFISSRFGWRWLRGQRNFHRGLDIAAARGTSIYAADSGTVSAVGFERGGLGYYVKIDHGNGIQTVYGHCMQMPHVSKGQKVYQNQVIAYVGSTGNSTGNHLHFAVYNKSTGAYINPEKYLP